jgi:hypothetical protein
MNLKLFDRLIAAIGIVAGMKIIYADINKSRADPWDHLYRVVEPALALAPATFLNHLEAHQKSNGVSQAVATYDSAPIFDWMMSLLPLQGISDQIASRYAEQHGGVTNAEIQGALSVPQGCSRLTSYWHFAECRYRKVGRTCAEPDHISSCPLPLPRLRKGSLNQAAYSLALFIRDVCGGDLVSWIDARLAEADPDPGAPERGPLMREAVLNPLREVYGIGPKLWAMMLADLLLGADPNRERWVAAGAWMIAVDSLVHNFLRRTGTLARFDAELGPGQSAVARHPRTKVVSDHRRDPLAPHRRDQAEQVEEQVVRAEGREVGFVGDRPRGGAAIATQIRGYDVVAGLGEVGHDLAPGIGQLWKAVQQQQAGSARILVPGFQQMHSQAVHAIDEARTNACGENGVVEGRQVRCVHFQPSTTAAASIEVGRQPSRARGLIVRQRPKRAGTSRLRMWVIKWGRGLSEADFSNQNNDL